MLVSCSCSYYNLDQYSKSPLAASTTCVTSRWPHWLSGRTSLILKEFKGGVTACRSHAVKQTSKSIKIFPQVPVFQTGSSTCRPKKSGIFRLPTFISGLPKKCVIRALSSVGYRNADASRSLLTWSTTVPDASFHGITFNWSDWLPASMVGIYATYFFGSLSPMSFEIIACRYPRLFDSKHVISHVVWQYCAYTATT